MLRKTIIWLALSLLTAGGVRSADEGTWKTAYVKRGFVGLFDAKWAGGIGGTQRMLTPLPYDGTKVRVFVRGAYEEEVELVKMSLLKGVDLQGKVTGKPFPILFGGSEHLKLEAGLPVAVSDEMAVPVTRGTWYVDDVYGGEKFPYAYDVDAGFCGEGDVVGTETLTKPLTCRTGILSQVDVLTTDPRTSILCYGDSITHGYNSTPNTDQRYPAILGKLLDRPVLNLGQNGDLANPNRNLALATKDLLGVGDVIFLMGINDIVTGSGVGSAEAYADVVRQIVAQGHELNRKVYIGTIPPAGGHAQFDDSPVKETLRQEINTWIRGENDADGIIDFDAALADPADPKRMRADCQSDWLHPNDLGYRRMAEAAAKALSGK